MLTLSIIKADTGGWLGHSAVHPDMVDVAREAIDGARGRLLIDGRVATCGDDLSPIALLPLDLELANQPTVKRWTPAEWVTAVLDALVPLMAWQPARRLS